MRYELREYSGMILMINELKDKMHRNELSTMLEKYYDLVLLEKYEAHYLKQEIKIKFNYYKRLEDKND